MALDNSHRQSRGAGTRLLVREAAEGESALSALRPGLAEGWRGAYWRGFRRILTRPGSTTTKFSNIASSSSLMVLMRASHFSRCGALSNRLKRMTPGEGCENL